MNQESSKEYVSLIDKVSTDESLPPEKKADLLNSIRQLPSPLQSDKWIYRMVVGFLGFTVISTVVGGFLLSFKTATSIPEGLIALGSAAVGALAGLLAPSPTNGR